MNKKTQKLELFKLHNKWQVASKVSHLVKVSGLKMWNPESLEYSGTGLENPIQSVEFLWLNRLN